MASDLVKSLWSKHPSRPLYHYTSPAGLIGIVESKSLWASGVQYLNDTAEYRHAASITQGLLTKYLQNENGPWNGYYGMLLQGLPFCTDTTVFVGSLSEAKDKLSQWRAYCSDGGGFSIGFDHKLIENQAKKHGFKLLKCEYNSANQESICAELISDGCRAAEEAESRFSKQEEPNREGLTAAGLHCGFVMPFMEIAPALKHPSFEEEQEWRLLRGPFDAPDPKLRFRPGRYAVIPYCEFPLADENTALDLEEIIVGPNPDTRQARKSVEYLLASRNVHCKRVLEYSGTYRNW